MRWAGGCRSFATTFHRLVDELKEGGLVRVPRNAGRLCALTRYGLPPAASRPSRPSAEARGLLRDEICSGLSEEQRAQLGRFLSLIAFARSCCSRDDWAYGECHWCTLIRTELCANHLSEPGSSFGLPTLREMLLVYLRRLSSSCSSCIQLWSSAKVVSSIRQIAPRHCSACQRLGLEPRMRCSSGSSSRSSDGLS